MYRDLKILYWWPGMKREISEFIAKCLTCQRVKVVHQVHSGKLYPSEIPEQKWDKVTVDFVSGLPLSVTGDRGQAYQIGSLYSYSYELFLRKTRGDLYLTDSLPAWHHSYIIFDQYPRFTSRFWKQLQESLGTKLCFNIAFHPQMDGQFERVIQVSEDMLKSYVIDFKINWERYMPLVEFTYKNNHNACPDMSPIEAWYGRKCRCPICWMELGKESQLAPTQFVRQNKMF